MDDAAAGGMAIGVMIVYGLVSLVSFAVWLYALIDVIKVQSDSEYRAGTKIIWILVLVFTGCIGAVIYLAAGKPKR